MTKLLAHTTSVNSCTTPSSFSACKSYQERSQGTLAKQQLTTAALGWHRASLSNFLFRGRKELCPFVSWDSRHMWAKSWCSFKVWQDATKERINVFQHLSKGYRVWQAVKFRLQKSKNKWCRWLSVEAASNNHHDYLHRTSYPGWLQCQWFAFCVHEFYVYLFKIEHINSSICVNICVNNDGGGEHK
jgi:hypothetical protein